MRRSVREIPLAARTVAVAATTGLALLSIWHSGGHVWRRLAADRRTYAAYTAEQRRQAPATAMQLPADVFDYYADRVRRGDRVYFLVMKSGFGRYFDLGQAVSAIGRFYLLPAAQVADPRAATVVLSYYADPASLGFRYLTQSQAGAQPIYVSRRRAP
jgi:hypothetical protein